MYSTAFQRIKPSYATAFAIVTALINYGLIILVRKTVEREVSIV